MGNNCYSAMINNILTEKQPAGKSHPACVNNATNIIANDIHRLANID
jgi:hypothetical protein